MDINLLPYREQQRASNKRLMIITLTVCGILFLFFAFIIHRSYTVDIDTQTAINNKLHKTATALTPGMNKLASIEKEKAQIEIKVKQLTEIEKRRYQTVQLLNIITEITPKGIIYRKIVRKNESVTLTGVAAHNDDVSELLKRIDDNRLFFNAGINEVVSPVSTQQPRLINFDLKFRLTEKKLTPPAINKNKRKK